MESGNGGACGITADPNYAQPWQMRPQRSSSGSAFIVNTKRRHIMTNAHVVRSTSASGALLPLATIPSLHARAYFVCEGIQRDHCTYAEAWQSQEVAGEGTV